ncbi:hypothetical protein CPC08DRAFT_749255 [Agrocybe pediades]|nr:hypothetical protein CPC08DRAFT_749255 [Agrocybe pediades]
MPGKFEASIVRAIIVLVFLLNLVDAAIVTLYRVHPDEGRSDGASTEVVTGTMAVTALGAGASGMTRYQELDVYERVVVHESGREPRTVVSTPITRTFNFEQGPSTMEAWNPRATAVDPITGERDPETSIECSMNFEKQTGECVSEIAEPIRDEGIKVVGTATATTTFTGRMEAFATVDVPNFAPSTTTITAPPLSNTAITNSNITININIDMWRSNKIIQVVAGINNKNAEEPEK